MLEVFRAIHDGADIEVFDLHRNPNDECIVGRHIRPVLGEMFAGISQAAAHGLENITLADCIASLAARIDPFDDAEELAKLKGANV